MILDDTPSNPAAFCAADALRYATYVTVHNRHFFFVSVILFSPLKKTELPKVCMMMMTSSCASSRWQVALAGATCPCYLLLLRIYTQSIRALLSTYAQQ